MKNKSAWLLNFSGTIYSQNGEDGIISKILDTLPERNKWCVEFGAWDGIHLSNTRVLIEKKDYHAVLIEGNKNKYKDLLKNSAHYPKIITINKMVGTTGRNNLDSILANTETPLNFDLLSIDIDGNDYHVWQSISKFTPKVVCIEFNPTIPSEVNFIQECNPNINHGSSIFALNNLAKHKGYELVSILSCNAIFVKSEYFNLFDINDNSIYNLRQNVEHISYLFTGYDGTLFLEGYPELLWHGIPLRKSRIQHLPRLLRKYPKNYTALEALLVKFYHFATSPLKVTKTIINRLFNK